MVSPLLKYRMKGCLAALGIRVRPSYPARKDLKGFCAHLARLGFQPTTIIDVGVADGTFDLYTQFPKARFLLVEPMAEFKPALAWISRRYSSIVELAALGSENGTRQIRFGNSIAEMHGATLQLSTGATPHPQSVRNIPVKRLDSLLAQHGLEGPTLLKVDVQGMELDVLQGAGDALQNMDVIVLEVSLFEFEMEQPLIADVFAYMAAKGFVAYDVFGGYGRPLDGALAQLDIAFVKSKGMFRRDTKFADPSLPEPALRKLVDAIRRWLRV
jgi:FkbM family methyltransferase